MGISSLTAKNVARDPNRQQSGRSQTGGAGSAVTLSRITPTLVAILQQNRMISRNTAVLPGMARDIGAMRQGITKLAKVQDIKPTTGADNFNVEAKGLEESYEARLERRKPTRVTSGTGVAHLGGDMIAGFLKNLLGMFKSGVELLFSNKGLLATGIMAALFPKESIDIMEALVNGLKMLGVIVLKVTSALAGFALWLSETFDLGTGELLASVAGGALGGVVGMGLGGAAGGAGGKAIANNLFNRKPIVPAAGAPAAGAPAAGAPAAGSKAKSGIVRRFITWATSQAGKSVLIRLGAQRLITAVAGLTVSGVGSVFGLILGVGLGSMLAYQVLQAFLEQDDEPATPEEQKKEEDAISEALKKDAESKASLRGSLKNTMEMSSKAAELLQATNVDFDDLRELLRIPRIHGPKKAKTPASPAPTPAGAPAPAPATTPTQVSKVDYIKNKLIRDLKIDDMDATAIVANLMQESGLKEDIVNKDPKSFAVGLAQWTGPRRKKLYEFADFNKEKIEGIKGYEDHVKAIKEIPIDKQLEFMVAELTDKVNYGGGTHSQALSVMKKEKTLADKVAAFEARYEVSGKKVNGVYGGGADMDKRLQYAANFSGTNVGAYSPQPMSVPMVNAQNPTVIVQNTNNTNTTAPVQDIVPAILTGIHDTDFMQLLLRRASLPAGT